MNWLDAEMAKAEEQEQQNEQPVVSEAASFEDIQAGADKKVIEQIQADDEEADAMEEFEQLLKKKKKKKKSKKKKKEILADLDSTAASSSSSSRPWDGTERDYTYSEMLDRVFSLIREKNPNLAQRKAAVLPPPQLKRMGKKTMWSNFHQICTIMHRSMEHVISYFYAELGTDGSVDGNKRLIIKGRYVPKQIEQLLKKYIVEYVTCHMCRSPDTTLTRDAVTRLYFLNCGNCGSTRTVLPIKGGFHATTRSERRAARNK